MTPLVAGRVSDMSNHRARRASPRCMRPASKNSSAHSAVDDAVARSGPTGESSSVWYIERPAIGADGRSVRIAIRSGEQMADDCALLVDQLTNPAIGEREQRVERVATEGLSFGGALHLDEFS